MRDTLASNRTAEEIATTWLRRSNSLNGAHHNGPTTRHTITPGLAMVPDTLTDIGYPLLRLRATRYGFAREEFN